MEKEPLEKAYESLKTVKRQFDSLLDETQDACDHLAICTMDVQRSLRTVMRSLEDATLGKE